MEKNRYNAYLKLLKKELVCAFGCTEPIAIAYVASLCKFILNDDVNEVIINVSPNIIKNVKSVVVPKTNGRKGIHTACAVGILFGDHKKELEVIKDVDESLVYMIDEFFKNIKYTIAPTNGCNIFEIDITLKNDFHSARVVAKEYHTNITNVYKDDIEIPYIKDKKESLNLKDDELVTFTNSLTIKEVIDFANEVNIDDVKEMLDVQIKNNMEIAKAGLNNDYGANIGKVLLKTYGSQTSIKARAYAAAASDARMNGCSKPVVIVSGSGNQGITASIPVIIYAKDFNICDEQLYRALIVSNLSTIRLKNGIGRLSAYCGVVAAGCGCGAGISYLFGGSYEEIACTLINSVAITSGIVCDGAKASCAGKISSAVDAGILGYNMSKCGNAFKSGEGIVKENVEHTIDSVGKLARFGMSETDKEIIRIMLGID